MKITTLALIGGVAFATVLTGCETETAAPDETATIVDSDSLEDGVVDLDNDSLAMDADSTLDETGAAIGTAADSAGAAVSRAAGAAGDVIDENVDLGENAENQ